MLGILSFEYYELSVNVKSKLYLLRRCRLGNVLETNVVQHNERQFVEISSTNSVCRCCKLDSDVSCSNIMPRSGRRGKKPSIYSSTPIFKKDDNLTDSFSRTLLLNSSEMSTEREDNDVNMEKVTLRFEHAECPSKTLNMLQLEAIIKTLNQKMDDFDAELDGREPEFEDQARFNYKDGTVKIVATNNATVNWVKEQVASIQVKISAKISLVVVEQEKLLKVSMSILNTGISLKTAYKRIKRNKPTVDFKSWKYLGHIQVGAIKYYTTGGDPVKKYIKVFLLMDKESFELILDKVDRSTQKKTGRIKFGLDGDAVFEDQVAEKTNTGVSTQPDVFLA